MMEYAYRDPAVRAAAIGLVGLAAAMGIGRFAFTPMLPLMQAHGDLSLLQGAKLAAANYVGYLLGSLLYVALSPRPAIGAKLGLMAVAVSTLAMAFTSLFWTWMVLRFLSGVASAFVLVGVSAWALAVLAAHRHPTWSGWVFAGVGLGILVVGLAALVMGAMNFAPASGWLFFGGAASLAAVLAAGSIVDATASKDPIEQTLGPSVAKSAGWRLIACYGTFGFGYIIPATFLPAASRALINNPAVFGWIWPVFGLAAAMSTVVVALILQRFTARHSWAFAQVTMAAGVALPAIDLSLTSMIISAVCVGGTFMVITMAGMLEARRVGGASTPRLMAAMTAAFATGQLLGPLTITGAESAALAVRGPSLLAAGLLFLTALALIPGWQEAAQQNNSNGICRG